MKHLLFAFLFMLGACNRTAVPEDPVWDKQPCDHCKMLISDKRYAASLIDDQGRRFFFDDIGCMAAFERDKPKNKARWVRDEESGAWIDAGAAYYRDGASTPMDYGYSAHKAAPGIDEVAFQQAVRAGGAHVHAH
jgi:copper chaperone NosL